MVNGAASTSAPVDSPFPRLKDRRVLLVLAVALVLRTLVVAAIAVNPERSITGSDAEQYLALAVNLVEQGVFSRDPAPPYSPEANRTPGYPALLVPFVALFGERPLLAVVVAQAILSLITIWLAMALGNTLFGPPVGLGAGWVLAFSPITLLMVGALYTETWYTFWLVGGMLLLALALTRDRWPLAGLGGLALGVSTLIRPIGLPLIALWGAIPLITTPLKRAWRHALACVVACLLVVLPWMFRNAAVFGAFSLSSIGAGNLYYYNVASVEADRLGISLDEAHTRLEAELTPPPPGSRWPSAGLGQFVRQKIVEHPLAFIWYNGVEALNGFRPGFSRLLLLVGPEGSIDDPISVFRQGNLGSVIHTIRGQELPLLLGEVFMAAFTGLLIILSAAGLILSLIRKRWLAAALLGLIPAALLYLPGSASNARFRSPVEPLLAVLTSFAVVTLTEWWHQRREQPVRES